MAKNKGKSGKSALPPFLSKKMVAKPGSAVGGPKPGDKIVDPKDKKGVVTSVKKGKVSVGHTDGTRDSHAAAAVKQVSRARKGR